MAKHPRESEHIGQHACSGVAVRAGLPASLAEASREEFLKAALAVFLHCTWLGDECKNLLWAFTFLCQFGLNLLLTWAGDSAVAEPAGSLSAEMRCVDAVTVVR